MSSDRFHFSLLLSILTLVELPNLRLKTVWRCSQTFKLAAANSVAAANYSASAVITGKPWYFSFFGRSFFWFFNNIRAAGYILASAGFVSLILAYLSGLAFD